VTEEQKPIHVTWAPLFKGEKLNLKSTHKAKFGQASSNPAHAHIT